MFFVFIDYFFDMSARIAIFEPLKVWFFDKPQCDAGSVRISPARKASI